MNEKIFEVNLAHPTEAFQVAMTLGVDIVGPRDVVVTVEAVDSFGEEVPGLDTGWAFSPKLGAPFSYLPMGVQDATVVLRPHHLAAMAGRLTFTVRPFLAKHLPARSVVSLAFLDLASSGTTTLSSHSPKE